MPRSSILISLFAVFVYFACSFAFCCQLEGNFRKNVIWFLPLFFSLIFDIIRMVRKGALLNVPGSDRKAVGKGSSLLVCNLLALVLALMSLAMLGYLFFSFENILSRILTYSCSLGVKAMLTSIEILFPPILSILASTSVSFI